MGGVRAVRDVSLFCDDGDMLGIIGPNGAGKTTLFNAICGFVRPDAGSSIRWSGREITGWRPERIARTRLLRTFQNGGGVLGLTVRENLELAARDRRSPRLAPVLERLRLTDQAERPVADCSLATRKLVGIAQAVVRDPVLLMLDEPLAGLDHTDREAVVDVIRDVHAGGVTVIFIEHDIERTLRLATRIVILDTGEKIADGLASAVSSQDDFHRAYLRG